MRLTSKILMACTLLLVDKANAQLTVGTGGMYIKSGATVILDRLHLQPNQDINIQNNTMSVNTTPALGNPNASISRVYQWTDTLQTKGLLGIYVQPAELNGNNLSQLQLAYNPDTNPNDYQVSNNSVVITNSGFVFETTPAISWKQLTAVEAGSVLPLNLLSFTGKIKNNFSLLEWQVTNEENTEYYKILRSADGKDFNQIISLPATCNGCVTTVTYHFEDLQPLTGYNYYKLMMVDKTGVKAFSRIVDLYYEPEITRASLSPNPVENLFTVSGLDVAQDYQVQAIYSDGKTVYTDKWDERREKYTVDASVWASGVYLVSVTGGTGVTYRWKIVRK